MDLINHVDDAQETTVVYRLQPRADRVDGEEVARLKPLGLDAQEGAPGGVQAAGSGLEAPGAKDPADSRLADLVAEAGQFPVPGWLWRLQLKTP
jgi:hypothetical protein